MKTRWPTWWIIWKRQRNRNNGKEDMNMKGIVKTKPEVGAVFCTDLPVPEYGKRDILVKVMATAICGTDQHIYKWTDYCVRQRIPIPMVFGHEFSGEVVAVGADVTEVKIGDHVAGETHIPCNHCIMCETDNRHICNNMKIIGVHVPGAFADYIAFPVDCAYKIPKSMDWKYGAMLEPMGVGVHGVDVSDVKGKKVVIYGCGPIGLMAVAAAKGFGADAVCAVDVFDDKLALAKQVGADLIVNSKTGDPKQVVQQMQRHGADVVIDYTGSAAAITAGFGLLRKGGTFSLVGLPNGDVPLNLADMVIYKEAVVHGVTGRLMYKTWQQCDELLTSGKVKLDPVIGGEYAMKDFDKAFDAIFGGAPGKMLLMP